MRNLKRALSLALASIMVLGMMVVGAGAVSLSDFSDSEKVANKEAVTVLTTLNVINGKEDGSYDPEGIVTRAEMAKMICVILNGGKDPQLGQTLQNSYTDTVGHWAAPYIEYCTTLGIVSGRGNGTFDPNGTVTVAEAGKMILVALGYNAGVEGYTGGNWQINTDVRANQKGLYDGLGTLNTNVDLTRDNAAQMLYNALDVRMVEYSYVITGTADNSISTKPQLNDNKLGTLLYEKFNAVKVEGVVLGNQAALLTSNVVNKEKDTTGGVIGSSLDAKKTRISITNDDDQNAYAGVENFNVSSDLDVLGRSVYLYVKVASSANKADVIGNVIVSEDNKVVTDYSGDSIKDVADDNSLDIVSTTKVVENYAAQAVLSDELAKKNGTTGIEKILIDTNDDGELDYVLLNTVELGKVTKYSEKDDGSITVSRANGKSFTADDKDDVVGFADVERDDVVLTSYIGGKLHVAKAESVTGTVEAYKLKNVTKTDYVGTANGTYTGNLTVDGTNYTISFAPTYTDSADFFAAKDPADKGIIDSEATFYLDGQGYIIARTEVDEAAYQYAYVWGAEAGGSISTDRVKVTLDDGTTKTYDLDSKSEIDVVSATTGLASDEINEYDMQGMIFAYTLNKNGDIKLLLPKKGAVNGDNPDHTKGMTAVKISNPAPVGKLTPSGETVSPTKTTYYANNSTVFFYVTMKGSNVDKVTVYIGRSSAPSVDGKQGDTLLALNSKGDIGAAAMTGTSAKEEAGDHLFVYANNYVHNDYVQVGAILNGETEGKDIQVSKYLGSDVTNNTVVADGLYLFTKDGDQYELEAPSTSSTFYKTGTVVRTPIKNTLVLGDNDEYMITSKSVIIDNTTGPNPAEGILGGAINKDDKVWMLINSDNEILMAYFVTPDDDTVIHGTIDPVATFDGSALKVRFYVGDGVPTNSQIAALLKDIDGVSSVTVAAAGTFNIVMDGITYTGVSVTPVPLSRVSYDGKDHFLAQNEYVVLADQTAANTLLSYTTASGVTTYTAASTTTETVAGVAGVKVYKMGAVSTSNKEVYLVDGYTYTDSSSGVTLPSSVVSASKTVPAGTELTVTSTAGNTVYAEVNSVKTAVVSGAKSETYTMPKAAVTFTTGTTPASNLNVTLTAAATDAGTYADEVYTVKSGDDTFAVSVPSKASTGDVLNITVTPEAPVAASVNLTLAVTSSNASVRPATISYSAGDTGSKTFQVTVTGTTDVTLTLTDDTSVATKDLTLPAGVTAAWDADDHWAAGAADASDTTAVPVGAVVTLTVASNGYHKVGTDFVTTGHSFTMADDLTVGDAYWKVSGLTEQTTAGKLGTTDGNYTYTVAATTDAEKVGADYFVKPSTGVLTITIHCESTTINGTKDTVSVTVTGATAGTGVDFTTAAHGDKTITITNVTTNVTSVTVTGTNTNP